MEERVKVIKRLFDIAYQMLKQQAGFHSTTERVLGAKDLFEKLPFFQSSFVNIYENSFLKEYPDENTLASITRNILELHNVFEYVNEYKLSKDEINFRVFSMHLHGDIKEKEILEKLQIQDEYIMTRWDFTLSLVQETDFYKSLDIKQQKNIIKAYKPYYWEYIKKRKYIVKKNFESGLYDLLSNLVHSYPLSTAVRSPYRYESIFSHKNVLSVCCEITIIYSASIIWSYLSLRSTVFRNIIQNEKEFIKGCLDTKPLVQIIDENRNRNTGFL